MNSMKTIVILGFISVALTVVNAHHDKEKFKKDYDTCKTKTGKSYTQEEMSDFGKGKCPTSEESKDVSACLIEESGYLTPDGKFNFEKAKADTQKIPDEDKKQKVLKMIESCEPEVSKCTEKAEIAIAACNCMMKIMKPE